jgi:soluble epoxide hydrolase/lipid-phosphate phosphatase
MTKSPLDYNHKYVKINGYNYHYVDEGSEDGELLVFVHGWLEVIRSITLYFILTY